jgi:hypothetical protein
MRAVLRVWWTLFTAVPLQRNFAWVGGILFGLAAVVGLFLREWFWLLLGYTTFVVLAAFPALFTAPALFRSLSAPRMYQLLPHLRLRMLVAVSLLLVALLVLSAGILLPIALAERAFLTPDTFFALGIAGALLVAIFLVLFLAFGDWRWSISLPLALVALLKLREWTPATASFVAALPGWAFPAAAFGAWAIFAAWYLRVRQVRPVMLMPQQRAVGLDAARPVPRTVAIRAFLASSATRAAAQGTATGFRLTPRTLVALAIALAVLSTDLRFIFLPSVFWPLTATLLFGERSVAIVRQSRLLWLNIPGARDAVRTEVEKVLWRHLSFGAAFLVVVAAIAASPFVGAGASRALLGLAMTAGAAIYGTYVAMAAVPNPATHLWGFGSIALLQLMLLVRPQPSLAAMAVVAAVELSGAALLRALAVRRWRTVDWLRLRPLSTLVGVPRSL